MRAWSAAAMLVACASIGLAFSALEPPAARAQAGQSDKQQPAKKPGRASGNDTCRFAHDNECDHPGIGTGACGQGTDYSDCRYLIEGEGDFCQWARDGECDEPSFGTGACVMGSDRTDCGDVANLRFRNDACATAFNNVCDEPGVGTGACAARTDRRDCVGAERPMSITDHFFGRDDRVLVNPNEMPWSAIGQLVLEGGEMCTATLIGPDVLITAAHCIHREAGVNPRGTFTAGLTRPGGALEARVTAYYVDARFNYRQFINGNDIDGLDWALLRLDRPLGDTLGFVGVRNLTGQGASAARAAGLYQAGFAWDTGEHLAGNIECHIVEVNRDNTFAHECDTTRGDSGSALMTRAGDAYSVIGVDSNFRSNPGGNFLYIAVSAASFERYVADFAARRIGRNVGGSSGKPKT
jgi:protease YdgD